MTFTRENTSAYTDAQLIEINDKWAAVAKTLGLESGTDEYSETYDRFCDAVKSHCDLIGESNIDWVAVFVRMDVAADLRDG
ncbi:hypothetical protein LCGC14_0728040 [marine sediment metagenome]|uniref:Uncharacterized protein n=1 Tax=marine sediment metagenome TaxID=412755 RepID=A0A0F9QVF8_9ZZZZ